jgi:hypothetical protein
MTMVTGTEERKGHPAEPSHEKCHESEQTFIIDLHQTFNPSNATAQRM